MNNDVVNPLLVRKYNQPLPRYTSYPTVPHWKDNLDSTLWKNYFSDKFSEQNHINGISLYIHLPFCESLCTYCGCNKKITTNHKVEEEYITALEKEWNLYRKLMKQIPLVREIHLGGGTPTFFSAKNLKRVIEIITKTSIIYPIHEFSIEGHPNNTSQEHLKVLFNLGFRRISFGVQDNDPRVQKVINRIQPLENVERVIIQARETGFTSVNFDLIYGLPLQTLESIERTIREVIKLKPDRIAFYSYAHVPWTSKAQRLFDEADLPTAENKILLYLKGKELLMHAGYVDIGMDHFALPHDSLFMAWQNGKLHRNFMGYTTQNTGILLGLGVSSISDTGNAYAQNAKTLREYYVAINRGELAIKKGYILNDEDQTFKKYILDISCNGYTNFLPQHSNLLAKYTFPQLKVLEENGLITWDEKGLELTVQGHYFIRVVCSAFDLYMHRSLPNQKQVFSQAI